MLFYAYILLVKIYDDCIILFNLSTIMPIQVNTVL